MIPDSTLRARALAATAISGLGLVTLLLLGGQLALHLRIASAAAVLIAIMGLAACLTLSPERPYRLGTLYLLLFALFHIGILVSAALGIPPPLLSITDARWVYSAAYPWAAVAVSTSMLCFLAGYFGITASRSTKRERPNDVSETPTAPIHESIAVGIVGLIVLALGIVSWFAVVIMNGPGLMTGSYSQFLRGTQGTILPFAYLAIGLGVSLAAAGSNAAMTRVSLATFAVFALPAFLLGLRGEVIIPIAVWLVVAARRRVIKFHFSSIIVLIAALAVGAAVFQMRTVGVGAVRWETVAISPADGLAELGYSIRPLVMTYQWHDLSHEPHVGLGTYIAPLERLVEGRLLGRPTISVAEDERVFSTVVATRVGPIGGSPAAEAYRAGGLTGMVAVMLLLGVITGLFDVVRRSAMRNALVGCAGFILLLWVRNDFSPVPLQIVCALLVLGIAWLMDKLLSARDTVRPQPVRAMR
ncbi:MAG: hypothetical protein QOG10_4287 [Kribbellaceae bacterium]|jgi:hypothetical protein|nr:hypothetical protein [Kribbellaceae bacterium]